MKDINYENDTRIFVQIHGMLYYYIATIFLGKVITYSTGISEFAVECQHIEFKGTLAEYRIFKETERINQSLCQRQKKN